MDTLQRLWKQFSDLLAGLPTSQRMTLLAVPLLVMGGLGVIVYSNREPARDYLLGGKVFTAEELRTAQEALRRAGLVDFATEGQKIRVPKPQVTQYNAALVEQGAMPSQYGEDLLKMHREAGIWATDADRRNLMEVGKSQELGRILRAISDIEDARVSWERTKKRSFTGEMKAKALVSIRPKAGRELSGRLVQSIRLSVAGALADLSPDDVVVLDERTGQAYQANSKDDPLSSEFVDQVRKFTDHYRKIISEALGHIPDVTVSVNVDLEKLKLSYVQERELGTKPFAVRSVDQANKTRSDERRPSREPGMQANMPRNLQGGSTMENVQTSEQTVATVDNIPSTAKLREQTFFGLLPKSVQVAVQIPRDFYRQVAIKQGESESANKDLFNAKLAQIEQETEAEVQKIVAKLVPAGSTADAINISSFTNLDSPVVQTGTPMLEIAMELLSRWGGPFAMGLFALWALWMFNRSLKTLPQAPPLPVPDPQKLAGKLPPDEEEDEESKPATKRDELQTLVRDNPEMAASVLSKWLTPAK